MMERSSRFSLIRFFGFTSANQSSGLGSMKFRLIGLARERGMVLLGISSLVKLFVMRLR